MNTTKMFPPVPIGLTALIVFFGVLGALAVSECDGRRPPVTQCTPTT